MRNTLLEAVSTSPVVLTIARLITSFACEIRRRL